MCGIFGAVSSGVQHPGEFYPFLSKVFVESERRGRDASGFAAKIGNRFLTDKDSCDAKSFTELSKVWRSIRTDGQISLIGHTRAATNGSPSNNKNNHPFHSRRYSMAHNGGIWSFEYIAKQNGFNLETDCDSELILHFLEDEKTAREGVIKTLSELEATSMMAVCFLDKETNIVHIFREKSAPTCVVYIERWNTVVFASTLQIIMDAASEIFGDWTKARDELRPIMSTNFPENTHLQLLPDGSWKHEDIKDAIDTNYDYAYEYTNVMWGNVYSGGQSKYERDKKKTKGDVVNDSNDAYFNSDTPTGDGIVSYLRCIECAGALDDEHYRGEIFEVGSSFMCRPCYIGDEEEVGSTSSPPADFESRQAIINQTRDMLPISMRLGIGNNPEQWQQIVDSIERERAIKEDYQLDDFATGSYISLVDTSRSEKLDRWKNMTLKRMFDMDDGEYLAYHTSIKDAIESVNV